MAAGAVVGTVFEIVEAPRPMPPLVFGVLIAAATGAFLAARWNPVATAVAVVAACLIYHVLGYPGLAPAVVLVVALYHPWSWAAEILGELPAGGTSHRVFRRVGSP
jgi:hypothetical protein